MKDEHVMDLFAYGMLAYTAWRTYDYMRANLAGVDAPTAIAVSLAFLMFSELGMLVWLHYGQPKATSAAQESVATVMLWIDFFGCMAVNLGDLVQHNTLYTVDLSNVDFILFIAPWVLVACNVAAYLVYKTTDSESSLEREERRLLHEEHAAEIKVRRRALYLVRRGSNDQAVKLAPHYKEDIEGRVQERTLARFGKVPADQAIQAEQDNQSPALPGEATRPVELLHEPSVNGKAHNEEITNPPNFP
jgi:hypothetical protein